MKKLAIGLGIWLSLGVYATYVRNPDSEVLDGSAPEEIPSEERMEADRAPIGDQICARFNQLDGTLEERIELVINTSVPNHHPVVQDFVRRHLAECPR